MLLPTFAFLLWFSGSSVILFPRKKEKKKLSEISITGNKMTQEPDNQSKKSKVSSIMDWTKIHVELTPPTNKNKQDYAGGRNNKTRDSQTRESGDSQSETNGCARNLDEEHKNEEDENYIDPPSKKWYNWIKIIRRSQK